MPQTPVISPLIATDLYLRTIQQHGGFGHAVLDQTCFLKIQCSALTGRAEMILIQTRHDNRP